MREILQKDAAACCFDFSVKLFPSANTVCFSIQELFLYFVAAITKHQSKAIGSWEFAGILKDCRFSSEVAF